MVLFHCFKFYRGDPAHIASYVMRRASLAVQNFFIAAI
jgi:hypothetical protein